MPDDDPRILHDGPRDGTLVVLAPGAGAPADSEWMRGFAAGLGDRGLHVARFDFPYMQERLRTGKRRGPDRPAVLAARWRQVARALGAGREAVIGGKSMGGRIASMVADELGVGGLVCLGYPFHPPGRPERTRTAHLAALATPTLVLQGTRDPFGTPGEVAGYELSERIRVHWLEDGDHSFKPRVRSGRTLQQNLEEALDAVAAFVVGLLEAPGRGPRT